MMLVRQLACLNFGTPSRGESTRIVSSVLSLSLSLSLSPFSLLLLVMPWMRDKGKVWLQTEQGKKRRKIKKRRIRHEIAASGLRAETERGINPTGSSTPSPFRRIRASVSVPTVLRRKIVPTSDSESPTME